ncbi:MAG: LysR family transcriptional regulator [Methylocystis sp.]
MAFSPPAASDGAAAHFRADRSRNVAWNFASLTVTVPLSPNKRIFIENKNKTFYMKSMDINLAKTFLEVAASGSFIAAAERLHLTQTAVSARIRTLENLLNRSLFVRNKAGARLTSAGERFVRYATTLVQVWEGARRHVALPPGRKSGVSLGGELSLWYPLLADWLIWMHSEFREVAIRAEVDSPARLLERVQEGSLDLAVLYNPPQRPDLVCELLMEEKLIQVTTDARGRVNPNHYVFVDWGPAFTINHQAAFPNLSNPPLSISLGPLALTYILTVGGSGYFRIGTAQPFLADGRLHRVSRAPEFSYSAYVVYATGREDDVIERVRRGLRFVAAGHEKPGIAPTIGARTLPSDLPKSVRRQRL